MDNGSSSYNRYLAGDDSAMSDLVHEYRDGLVVFLNSFTNDIFEAEELMVETFFKLAYKKTKILREMHIQNMVVPNRKKPCDLSFDMKKLMAFAASLTILTSAAESPLASADAATDINDISNAELTIFSEMDNENTDINIDGKFDVKDTYEFLAYMYGYDTDEAVEKNILANADYDGNGTVEKNDAELLLKYLIPESVRLIA